MARLRARAEGEGGPGALEEFAAADGSAPDADALIGSIPALSLTASHRYLLADGVERWSAAQAGKVAAALADLGPDMTVVLIARGKAPAKLAPPSRRPGARCSTTTRRATATSRSAWSPTRGERGFTLEPAAARLLVERMGTSTRAARERARSPRRCGPGPSGEVTLEDLESMVADTSEAADVGAVGRLIGGASPPTPRSPRSA